MVRWEDRELAEEDRGWCAKYGTSAIPANGSSARIHCSSKAGDPRATVACPADSGLYVDYRCTRNATFTAYCSCLPLASGASRLTSIPTTLPSRAATSGNTVVIRPSAIAESG